MKSPDKNLCPNCNMPIAIRNPSGKCDHLYYPDNVPEQKSPEELAREIVKKSRHKSINALGEEYEPLKKLIENLHKNIPQALTQYAEERVKEALTCKCGEKLYCPKCRKDWES